MRKYILILLVTLVGLWPALAEAQRLTNAPSINSIATTKKHHKHHHRRRHHRRHRWRRWHHRHHKRRHKN